MNRECIEVVKPGLLTTVQDRGRYGYLKDGIVAAGVMDTFAYEVANELVGNYDGEAVLEVTLVGPELQFLADTIISICGANFSPNLDGKPIWTWWSTSVKKGQILSFEQAQDGIRAYIAVRGGIDVPIVLGSRSTYINGEIGGFMGRALIKGDVLFSGDDGKHLPVRRRGLKKIYRPNYVSQHPFRVILGPDDRLFTNEAIAQFFKSEFVMTHESNRMGSRLKGIPLNHRERADILSDAVTFGTIQVPGDGQPIVLLADRQTTGGYARIGHIISQDLPRFVQQKPGTKIRFAQVDGEYSL